MVGTTSFFVNSSRWRANWNFWVLLLLGSDSCDAICSTSLSEIRLCGTGGGWDTCALAFSGYVCVVLCDCVHEPKCELAGAVRVCSALVSGYGCLEWLMRVFLSLWYACFLYAACVSVCHSVFAFSWAYAQTRGHTHAYTRTNAYTHTHTYIHTRQWWRKNSCARVHEPKCDPTCAVCACSADVSIYTYLEWFMRAFLSRW